MGKLLMIFGGIAAAIIILFVIGIGMLVYNGISLNGDANGVAQDRKLCTEESAAAIAACTLLIWSGKESPPDLFLAYYWRGRARYQYREYDSAIRDFSEAITFKPKDENALYSRGLAFDASGDHDRAIRDFTSVIKLDPDNASAFHSRGNAYFEKNDNSRAVQDFDEAIRLNPFDEWAKITRANAELKALPYPYPRQ
jgi:tetratricopeptide (TPR) repeat protein